MVTGCPFRWHDVWHWQVGYGDVLGRCDLGVENGRLKKAAKSSFIHIRRKHGLPEYSNYCSSQSHILVRTHTRAVRRPRRRRRSSRQLF